MYNIGKTLQAIGLTVILIGFLARFPQLMHPRMFLIGIIVFVIGWVVLRMQRRY